MPVLQISTFNSHFVAPAQVIVTNGAKQGIYRIQLDTSSETVLIDINREEALELSSALENIIQHDGVTV